MSASGWDLPSEAQAHVHPVMVRQITRIKMGKCVSSNGNTQPDGAKRHDVPQTGLVKAPLRAEGKCERQVGMPVNIIFSFSRQPASVLLDQPAGENERVSPAHSSRPTNTVCSGGGRGGWCLSVLASVILCAINEMCQNSFVQAACWPELDKWNTWNQRKHF